MAQQAHMTMLEDLKRAAWARTNPVDGQANGWEFRKDCLGNLVRYADYANRHSPFGWELDYIGSETLENLRVLHWRTVAARKENIPARVARVMPAHVAEEDGNLAAA